MVLFGNPASGGVSGAPSRLQRPHPATINGGVSRGVFVRVRDEQGRLFRVFVFCCICILKARVCNGP